MPTRWWRLGMRRALQSIDLLHLVPILVFDHVLDCWMGRQTRVRVNWQSLATTKGRSNLR